jgi:hypothetical protein
MYDSAPMRMLSQTLFGCPAAVVLVGLVACAGTAREEAASASGKSAAPATAEAAKPAKPAPGDFMPVAQQTIAALGAKDFQAFARGVMASKVDLKTQQERAIKNCPELGSSGAELVEAYDPAGAGVKAGFDQCLEKHDWSKATFVSATAREHTNMCGEEIADHVEVVVSIAGANASLVLDDLIKTPAGWRVVDAGIRCD